MDDDNVMVETPEEAAFFENKGETVAPVVETPTEPIETPEAEPQEPVQESTKPNHVPLAVLLAEREKHAQRMAKFESRIEKLQELIQPKAEPERIDPQLDPIKAIEHLNQKLEQLENEKKTVGEVNALAQFGQRQAQAFAEKAPDFYDAYNHLRHSRADQLMNSGAVSTPQELNDRVLREEQDIIKMCANMGIDPAQFMYNLAQTAGYKTPQPVVQAPTPEQKIKIAATGQQRAGAGISKVGAGSNGPVDLKALLNSSDSEFDKLTASDADWRRLAGG